MSQLPAFKEEDLTTPLDGQNPLAEETATNSSQPIKTRSASNRHSQTMATSNDPTTGTSTASPPSNDDKDEIASNNSQAEQEQEDTEFPSDLTFQQAEERMNEVAAQLEEAKNACQKLQKERYDFKSDYFEFKTNFNAKLDALKNNQAKMRDEINQLKAEMGISRIKSETQEVKQEVKEELKDEFGDDIITIEDDEDCKYGESPVKRESGMDGDD